MLAWPGLGLAVVLETIDFAGLAPRAYACPYIFRVRKPASESILAVTAYAILDK